MCFLSLKFNVGLLRSARESQCRFLWKLRCLNAIFAENLRFYEDGDAVTLLFMRH